MSSERPVFVTGIGCRLPGASNRRELVGLLQAPATRLAAEIQGRPILGARVPGLPPDMRIPPAKRRRLNRIGLLSVLSALDALEDAGVAPDDLIHERTGIVVGTGYGCSGSVGELFREVLKLGPDSANPAIFPTSVPNGIASQVALVLRIAGPNITVSQGEVSGETALALGCDWIRRGTADRVLVGGADELTDHLVDYLTSLGITAPADGRALPFDRRSQGAGIGEGAVFLVLESDAGSERSHARFHRWSIQATPTGASSIDPDGHALSLAVEECLADREDARRLVICGASGHPETDLAHLHGLARALGGTDTRVTAHKGLWGESLSSGVAAAAVAVCSLETGRLPALPGVSAEALNRLGLMAVTPGSSDGAPFEALLAGTARGGTAAALVIGRA